jgi:hypothetical protein
MEWEWEGEGEERESERAGWEAVEGETKCSLGCSVIPV